MEELWIAMDKNGTVHFSNIELVKPSEMMPNNPDANDEIFIPITTGYHNNGNLIFSIIINRNSPLVPKDLTFENSPRQIKGFVF